MRRELKEFTNRRLPQQDGAASFRRLLGSPSRSENRKDSSRDLRTVLSAPGSNFEDLLHNEVRPAAVDTTRARVDAAQTHISNRVGIYDRVISSCENGIRYVDHGVGIIAGKKRAQPILIGVQTPHVGRTMASRAAQSE